MHLGEGDVARVVGVEGDKGLTQHLHVLWRLRVARAQQLDGAPASLGLSLEGVIDAHDEEDGDDGGADEEDHPEAGGRRCVAAPIGEPAPQTMGEQRMGV